MEGVPRLARQGSGFDRLFRCADRELQDPVRARCPGTRPAAGKEISRDAPSASKVTNSQLETATGEVVIINYLKYRDIFGRGERI